MFYVQTITCGTLILLVALFFKETRGSVLLSRKARALNQWYEERGKAGHVGFEMLSANGGKKERQRIRWKVKSDEERDSLGKMIGISLYRPFCKLIVVPVTSILNVLTPYPVLLLTEPVVFFFSLWISFSWAVLYLFFTGVPLVFHVSHGFNIQQSAAVFSCKLPNFLCKPIDYRKRRFILSFRTVGVVQESSRSDTDGCSAMCIGAILSTIINIYQEKIAKHYNKLASTPEDRLYFTCIESALSPIGMFWFGKISIWKTKKHFKSSLLIFSEI